MAKLSPFQKRYRKFRKRLSRHARRYRRLIRSRAFADNYAIFSLIVLFLTTMAWSLLGASLHNQNADQLVDPALFHDSRTLHGAAFPAAHSQLIKWPLFWIIAAFDSSTMALRVATVLVSLITVGGLALIIHKTVTRRLYFGTLILALASCLLLIPSQPYAGALLPLNFAMIATRNIEYLIYVLALWLVIRARGLKSLDYWLAAIVLSLLFASDRLFLTTSLFGALIMTIVYFFRGKQSFFRIGLNWTGATLFGTLISAALLKSVNHSGLLHIIGTSSPYGIVHNLHDLVLGILYGILNIFTNFGANPAYDATVVRKIPAAVVHGWWSFGGLSLLLNLGLVALMLLATYQLVKESLVKNFRQTGVVQTLALMLVSSSLAAYVLFISSRHYYAVDARYLTIVLFALFAASAWRMRQVKISPDKLLAIGGFLTLGMVLSLVFITRIHTQANSVLNENNVRNQNVADVLKHHKVDGLVGDYWRVLPLTHDNRLNVSPMPLVNCTDQYSILTSSKWQLDLKNHSFAYLLSLDRSLTDFPNCSLEQVAKIYGRPNSSVLIAGDPSQPKELLLFYDRGINIPQTPAAQSIAQAALLPTDLAHLPATRCDNTTIINIVAHEDDDLLYLSPALLHHLTDGDCVRTIYLTAGDAGHDRFYWLGRERGTEAAYAAMLNADDNWLQRTVKLGANQYASFARLSGHSGISLIFMHLPDGNLNGDGFRYNQFESLAKLMNNQIPVIHSTDGQSTYSHEQLVGALAEIIKTFGGNEIDTQSTDRGKIYPDHSDHNNVGRLSTEAHDQLNNKLPIFYFVGYPAHAEPANVEGSDLGEKARAFAAYTRNDEGICWDRPGCHRNDIYEIYLQRQYSAPN